VSTRNTRPSTVSAGVAMDGMGLGSVMTVTAEGFFFIVAPNPPPASMTPGSRVGSTNDMLNPFEGIFIEQLVTTNCNYQC